MTVITRETLSKLYKKQKTSICFNYVLCIGLWLIAFILFGIFESAGARMIILAAVIISQIVVYKITRKKIIPKGNGKNVMKAMQFLNNDFTSDSAINKLYELIGKTEDFSDKTMLFLLLSDIYNIRGQFSESLNILKSIDQQQLFRCPEVGMSYYSQIISTFSSIVDNESVLAAFNDAAPFIEECSKRNYNCCNVAMNIQINVEAAKGNYRSALEMKLAKNEFDNKLQRDASAVPENPLRRFSRGSVFVATAKLFYLNGDYLNAAKNLDIGGPLTAVTPYLTSEVNKFSAELRDLLSKKDEQ